MPVGRERAERQPEAHRVLDEQQLHVAAVDRNRFAAAERGGHLGKRRQKPVMVYWAVYWALVRYRRV